MSLQSIEENLVRVGMHYPTQAVFYVFLTGRDKLEEYLPPLNKLGIADANYLLLPELVANNNFIHILRTIITYQDIRIRIAQQGK